MVNCLHVQHYSILLNGKRYSNRPTGFKKSDFPFHFEIKIGIIVKMSNCKCLWERIDGRKFPFYFWKLVKK